MKHTSARRRAKRAEILPRVVACGSLRLVGTVEALNRPPRTGDAVRAYGLGAVAYALSSGSEIVPDSEAAAMLGMTVGDYLDAIEGVPEVSARLADGAIVQGRASTWFPRLLEAPTALLAPGKAEVKRRLVALIDRLDREGAPA